MTGQEILFMAEGLTLAVFIAAATIVMVVPQILEHYATRRTLEEVKAIIEVFSYEVLRPLIIFFSVLVIALFVVFGEWQ